MNPQYCKRTARTQTGEETVNNCYPMFFLEPNGEIQNGFRKGTLQKATFELNSGTTIIYEAVED